MDIDAPREVAVEEDEDPMLSDANIASDSYSREIGVQVRLVRVKTEITSDFIKENELVSLIATRARMIEKEPNQVFVEVENGMAVEDIARRELDMKRCPLKLRRQVGFQMIDGVANIYYEEKDPNQCTLCRLETV